mmetsp:Transcript_29981/g.64212  ORF Transcript_29981/g.64212 Transcript_29981/m.64212 type:complete len:255 (+) Transcript_29981:34-798(+)|eukprot:CAMPEP_0201138722 /NCGR_PEP_ID=MMETSP0850-20130426/56074_1 /ASSEMBLY_ACC=CAM_ASM_000622 /TAXON_ID=183588 /ORGANISM="Pseudo-nitzschia fraudulenta, Strain WWA7" /LENGTH=254 /DNA_ID=CAMNT_0047410121 /DNA_START=142 /DNA_END=906 /DNA_ORIENTATION=-
MSSRRFAASVLFCLVVFATIRLSACFTVPRTRKQARPPASVLDSGPRKCNHCTHGRSQLLSKKSNDDPNETNNKSSEKTDAAPISPDVALLTDPGLWVTDLLALILASQLIGLLDVVNNPEFIQNGGWFQPIPAVPSTLDDLVQRISSFGITWGVASASTVFFAKASTDANETEGSADRNDTTAILNRNIQTLVLFAALQITANGIFFGFVDNNNGFIADGTPAVHLLDVLRNCYYVGLSSFALRYLYGRYFLL